MGVRGPPGTRILGRFSYFKRSFQVKRNMEGVLSITIQGAFLVHSENMELRRPAYALKSSVETNYLGLIFLEEIDLVTAHLSTV